MNLSYDLDSHLTLELRSPTATLRRVVERQLDPWKPRNNSDGSPDLVLAPFTGDLSSAPFVLGNSGDNEPCRFGQDAFVAFPDGPISLDFESIGQGCTLGYTSRTRSKRLVIEYVRPILQMCLLNKGMAALHAAAVEYEGNGILFAGWAESGKSEAMMSFLAHGASFISDKWSIVSPETLMVSHFPTPITVRSWMLDALPSLHRHLGASNRARVGVARRVSGIFKGLQAVGAPSLASKVVQVGSSFSSMASGVSLTPTELLTGLEDGQGTVPRPSAKLSRLFLLRTKADGTNIEVRPATDVPSIARQLAECAIHERRHFFDLYTKFKYAQPGRRNELLERSLEIEAQTILDLLGQIAVFTVELPFPFNPQEFYEALRENC